ncbi:MAG: hypothetical protein CMN73_06290 [Sphingomonas sp.]|nr:hypothetical protein [Sphingomonas sp.]|tara:strand:+ start:2986 stop:3426 length:441 start_codon:yes stop_codon:yes gene_type:complete
MVLMATACCCAVASPAVSGVPSVGTQRQQDTEMTVAEALAGIEALFADMRAHAPTGEGYTPTDEEKAFLARLFAAQQHYGQDYRALVDAQKAAGETPRSCLPPPGAHDFKLEDFLPLLRAVPESERATTSLREISYRFFDQQFRCE